MSFREGLEACLIVVLIFKFLAKTGNQHLNRNVINGAIVAVLFSLVVGYLLFSISIQLDLLDEIGKLWESVASLIAVGTVSVFIVWMIRNGNGIKQYVEDKTAVALTKSGLLTVSFLLIAREGVEIVLFSFAGKYDYISIVIGLVFSATIALAIYYSLVKINIIALFKITLVYIIVQAGYLLGYGVHEGFSALHSAGYIQSENILLSKVFDYSETFMNHKEGIVGLPLNVLFGWYSKPEWLQFIIQYIFTLSLFAYWRFYSKNRRHSADYS
ncbi:MAG: FTR1 family protein [Patescibacteria group bacterium]